MELIKNTNSFLRGVGDSSILHGVGFMGFVTGNIMYYNLFSSKSWIYKYITSITTIGCIGGVAYYLHNHKTIYINNYINYFSYITGAIIPHVLFIRNINIIRDFDKYSSI